MHSVSRLSVPKFLCAAVATAGVKASLAAAILAAASPAKAKTAFAPETPSVGYAYKFYVGGVLVGKAQFRASFDADGYRGLGSLQTDGVAGWFVAAQVDTEATGVLSEDAAMTPEEFVLKSVADKKPQDVRVVFANGAPTAVEAEPPFKAKPHSLDPTRQGGALDPISAIVRGLLPQTAAGPCDRAIPIFDGLRRWDLILGGAISEDVDDDGAPLIECEARFKRVAGFKQKHMRKPDFVFTARFKLQDGLAIPTKVWGDTEFGGAVAVLR